jgi:hypothetical protein
MLGRWLMHRFRCLRLRLRNPWNSGGSLFCSEAVTMALHAINYPGSWSLMAGSESPQSLLNFFRKRNTQMEEQ